MILLLVRDGVKSVDEGLNVSSAVTRQQTRQANDKLPVKLKVSHAKEVGITKHIERMQQENKMLDKIRKYVAMHIVFQKSARESHCFVEKRGIFYRRVELNGCLSDQLVVPREFKTGVMELAHSAVIGGHLGFKKTLAIIQSKFVWPGNLVRCVTLLSFL